MPTFKATNWLASQHKSSTEPSVKTKTNLTSLLKNESDSICYSAFFMLNIIFVYTPLGCLPVLSIDGHISLNSTMPLLLSAFGGP